MSGPVEHKNDCLICGSELVYHDTAQPLECSYCRRTLDSNVACADGHYICDECHSLPAIDLIRQYCLSSQSTDPLEMAMSLMKHPAVKMHGPEHHFLVPAVLLASYYNIKGDTSLLEKKLLEAEKRAGQILGGFCGFYGNCGAAVGTGIFLSLITDTTPLSVETWQLCNMLTSKSLMSVALHGGPRCCKRNTYLALAEATKFVREHLGDPMDVTPGIKCEFTSLNKECIKGKCPFYSVA